MLRILKNNDRCEEDYLAETEFVHYPDVNKAPVADVFPCVNGRTVETLIEEGKPVYVGLFCVCQRHADLR